MNDSDGLITPEMKVVEALRLRPEALPLFRILGFRAACGTCKQGGVCTVETAHCAPRRSSSELTEILQELNTSKPDR